MSAAFTTADVVSGERLDYWRELVCRHFVPLRITSQDGNGFHGSARLQPLGEVDVVRVRAHSMAATRGASHIDELASGEYFVALQVHGLALAQQEGRTAILRPGDFALLDSDRPYTVEFRGAALFEHVILRVPHAHLDIHGAGLDSTTAVTVKAGGDGGRIASPALHALVSMRSRAEFAEPVLDLVARALRKRAGLERLPESGASRTLREIKRVSLNQLADPGLSPATVAAAVFVSTRHLHRLFAQQGEATFGAFLKEARLRRCYRDLSDPKMAGVAIAQIATRWGFRSGAHFTRAFIAQYGTAPRELRRSRSTGSGAAVARRQPATDTRGPVVSGADRVGAR
jgi:AraC-like DNA-binding protein